MEEQEFERLLDVMESIDSKLDDLENIKTKLSPTWDAHDICQRLDTIISLIQERS